jgi:hypothetical protein
MGYPVTDLTGQRFGRLVVVRRADTPSDNGGNARWHCRCDCGNETDVLGFHLRQGRTVSCGCLQKELARAACTTHGQTGSRLYVIWGSMRARCENPHNQHYDNYGGRGITVCEEWHDFVNFMQWAERTGYRENLTIDRIDVNEGYNPVNCRWVTMHEQNRNKRNNINITYHGVTRCLADWAATLGINAGALWMRICRYNWDIDRAFTTPVQIHHKRVRQEEQVAS